MRWYLFALLCLTVPLLAATHTLLEFREISTIKLIVGHEKIQIFANEVFSDMEMLNDDIKNYNCTISDCDKGKKLIIDALNLKNATIRSVFTDTQVLTRKKRSWDPFGKSLKWIGGVMDSDDREVLNSKVQILYENQKTIYEQMESFLSKPDALKAENVAEFIEVENELKHVQELIGIQSFSERFERISSVIDGIWRTFFNKKIDGIFVTSDALEKVKEIPRLACANIVECIKSADAQVEMENSKLIIILKIPTVTEQQLKLYEITSTPSDLDNNILLLKLPQQYFGYDEHNKKIITVNENNLILCRKEVVAESTIMFCRAQDIIRNVNNDECLEKAFRDKEIDLSHCGTNMELWQSAGFGVVELGNGNFWMHTKKRKDMTILCGKNDREIKTFKNSEIFHLLFGCHAAFRDGIDLTSYAVSDESTRLNSISANISKSTFTEAIDTMAVSVYLRNGFLVNIESFKPKGLSLRPIEVKAKSESQSQPINAEELKTIRAQHHEALIIVAVLAVSLMLFIALKSGKPYIMKFLPPPQPKDIDEEQDVHDSEEKTLNEKKM